MTVNPQTKERLVAQADSEKEKHQANAESLIIEELKKTVAEEKAKAEANLIGWQRAQADYVNYKRFAEQDKADTCKFANAGLLSNILPILDDFERALGAVPEEAAKNNWVEGLKMIDRKFRDTLQKQGVTSIPALGMEFDPRIMDAVTMGKGKKDMVVAELEKGYKLQDRVIRPARVVVGNGEEDQPEELLEGKI
jgi:molecular chaperone GrpE